MYGWAARVRLFYRGARGRRGRAAAPCPLRGQPRLPLRLPDCEGWLWLASRRDRITSSFTMPFQVEELSIQLIEALVPLMPRIKQRDNDLENQLRRAASSIGLNVAEAALSDPGKKRARPRAAGETQHALRQAVAWPLVTAREAEAAVGLVRRIDYADTLADGAMMQSPWSSISAHSRMAKNWCIRTLPRRPSQGSAPTAVRTTRSGRNRRGEPSSKDTLSSAGS
jgi:four helix bundle protein